MNETWGGEDARRWFPGHTLTADRLLPAADLVARKQAEGLRISVGLPSMNEAETIGPILEAIRSELMEQVPLVDDLAVLDGGSTDDTHAIAKAAGAEVFVTDEVLPDLPAVSGKGEALWRSVHSLRGDIIVWVDSDIRNFGTHFVTRLIAPLVTDLELRFVKGYYTRPLQHGDELVAGEGGRVTELLARPLLWTLFPELSGFIQPLAGEYAGRRDALVQVPFFTGYSVEIGLLIDLLETVGLDGMAQVDLGERVHRNRPLGELTPMAAAIGRTILARAAERGRISGDFGDEHPLLVPAAGELVAREIVDVERPPMRTIEEGTPG